MFIGIGVHIYAAWWDEGGHRCMGRSHERLVTRGMGAHCAGRRADGLVGARLLARTPDRPCCDRHDGPQRRRTAVRSGVSSRRRRRRRPSASSSVPRRKEVPRPTVPRFGLSGRRTDTQTRCFGCAPSGSFSMALLSVRASRRPGSGPLEGSSRSARCPSSKRGLFGLPAEGLIIGSERRVECLTLPRSTERPCASRVRRSRSPRPWHPGTRSRQSPRL